MGNPIREPDISDFAHTHTHIHFQVPVHTYHTHTHTHKLIRSAHSFENNIESPPFRAHGQHGSVISAATLLAEIACPEG